MTKLEKIDLAVLIVSVPLAAALSLLLRANYFESDVLFLGIPCLYISFRVTSSVLRKAFIFSSIFSIPLGIFVDYLVTMDKGWSVTSSTFPMLFGIVPLEDILFAFLFTYLAVIFYERFVDKGPHRLIRDRLHYLVSISLYVTIFFVVTYLFFGEALTIPYAFLITGVVFLLAPLAYVLLRFPRLLRKFIPLFAYFLYLSIFFEATALYLKQWEYLGLHYIALVQVATFPIPAEEIVFFWLLWGPAILAYYEFFDDDRK